MNWFARKDPAPARPDPAVLLVSLDGFLSAGSAPAILGEYLHSLPHEVVRELDLDDYYDYRARRPPIVFHRDHYRDLKMPSLDICEARDAKGERFFFLTGPEPDYRWEQFADELIAFADEQNVSLVLFLGAVPMGVPHTRPLVITSHGTRPELVDRPNLWDGEVIVPAAASTFTEYRMSQGDLDAAGYVVHVPHYLSQIEFPTAALSLLDTVTSRTGLHFDVSDLRRLQAEALSQIEQQIDDQDGGRLLEDLERQYDVFTRGSQSSLLADDEPIPSADELARQFEQFLAARDKTGDDD